MIQAANRSPSSVLCSSGHDQIARTTHVGPLQNQAGRKPRQCCPICVTWTAMSKFSLILLCAAQFMVILDITVVNIALPSIQQDLGLATKDLQWVITAYTLAFGGLLLLGGRAADLFGRRRVFLTGLAVFTLASLGAALAGSAAALIAARIGQGVGAAMLSPAALSLVTTLYDE